MKAKEPEKPKESFRPVNPFVNSAIGAQPTGPFNYGLYFNKWFYVHLDSGKCPVEGNSNPIDNLIPSVTMFNGDPSPGGGFWDRKTAQDMLKSRHAQQVECTSAWKSLGYDCLTIEASLSSSLVVGLGCEHPTEKGFRFDWSTGVPVIPASGIKGVVRLAWLVNALNQFVDPSEAQVFWRKALSGILPEEARRLFGSGESAGQTASRGGAVFMDAYPAKLPRLKVEIMNCHYSDYLNHQTRPPTEDQQLNPQKFWAVDPFMDGSSNARTAFVFRVLIGPQLATDQHSCDALVEAFNQAVTNHGFGAKTAVGHGRFSIQTDAMEPSAMLETPGNNSVEVKAPAVIEVQREVWRNPHLLWSPGNAELTAKSGNKNARGKGIDMVPEQYRTKLKKKKAVDVESVEVEPVGNGYIIKTIH